MAEFKITHEKPTPRAEQETIITYDKETDEWHFYSDNPVHCKRWEASIIPSDVYCSFKRIHIDDGSLIAIDGKINGSVSIRQKKEYSEKEKQIQSERMKQLHLEGKL